MLTNMIVGTNVMISRPIVSCNAGTAFQTVSACASSIAAYYPDAVAGTIAVVTTSSGLTALAVYDGTIWTKN